MRIAFRSLLRTPLVSLAVVLSLALGIGANTAIFSLMHQALLKSLPVQDPQELVLLKAPGEFKSGDSSTDNSGGIDYIFNCPTLRGLERQHTGLSSVAAHVATRANIAFRGQTRHGALGIVSGAYFDTLGVRPLAGRLLGPDDDRPGAAPVVVLSYGYWKDRLGGRADVLRQPIRVNNHLCTIVGIAPADFYGLTLGSEPELYAPLTSRPQLVPGSASLESWSSYYLYVFGRRAPGLSMAQSEAALNTVYTGLKDQQLKSNFGGDAQDRERYLKSRLTLMDGTQGASSIRERLETPLRILLICTALVVLIAAANAANLLLARAARRGREISVRVALGASRWHIVRQLLTEALLLAFSGGLAGILCGVWMLDLLLAMMRGDNDPVRSVVAALDVTTLAYAFGVTLLSGIIFGLYPAWAASHISLATTLKDESGNSSATRGGVRVRRMLVTAQVAFSLLLLVPTGLFLRSLVNLMSVDLGMRTAHLVTFSISPSLNGYTPQRATALFERAERELSAVPGVTAVTAAKSPLVAGSTYASSIDVEGVHYDRKFDRTAAFNAVGPGFFTKMGVPMVAGRDIRESDTAASQKIAVVSETWVKHFSPNTPPLGRRFRSRGSNEFDTAVVGVVKDTRIAAVREETRPQFFTPYRQEPDENRTITFYMRSTLPVDQLNSAVRRVMTGLDSDLPIQGFRTFDDQVRRSVRNERMLLTLAAAFAVLATLLAMLGLYGVLAFNVARRTREIGIRMALGAAESSIGGMVMREVAVVLGVGALIGLPAALALARFAQSVLYGVKAFDPAVAAGALTALAVAAVLAGWIPARRAARINPIRALHYE